jgi:hypothetical protein
MLTLAVAPWTAGLSPFEAVVRALVRYQVLQGLDASEVDGECGWDEVEEVKLDLM